MKNHPLLTKEIVAILCITAIGITALLKGLDSGLLTAIVTALAGLGGFMIGKATTKK